MMDVSEVRSYRTAFRYIRVTEDHARAARLAVIVATDLACKLLVVALAAAAALVIGAMW